jgi:hypothetical protein
MGMSGLLLLLLAACSFIDEESVDPAASPQIHTTTDNPDIRTDEGMVSGDTMDICIIGGGASGLSALQVIMGTPQYKSGQWKTTLFEARDKTGGVW